MNDSVSMIINVGNEWKVLLQLITWTQKSLRHISDYCYNVNEWKGEILEILTNFNAGISACKEIRSSLSEFN